MTAQLDDRKAHRHREDLTGEHKTGDAGQLILAVLFILIWITDTFLLKYTTFLNQHLSLGIRIPVGIAVLLSAWFLARSGLRIVFGEEQEKPGVIREGVFNVMRHPVYVGELLLYLGMLILSLSLAAGVVWLIAIVFLNFISCFEEKLLLQRFGEEYQQYMREVPMWIPRIFRSGRSITSDDK